MKYIRTIEEMLDESVSETINRIGLITEMAVPLKKYKERVDGLRFQLVENWCLCRYCQLFDTENICFKHWINELEAVIENLKFLDIKDRISKEKTLTGMLISDYDYNDSEMIKRIMAGKFKKEKITDLKKIESVCLDFANSIGNIIDVISNDNIILDDYLEDTFDIAEKN